MRQGRNTCDEFHSLAEEAANAVSSIDNAVETEKVG